MEDANDFTSVHRDVLVVKEALRPNGPMYSKLPYGFNHIPLPIELFVVRLILPSRLSFVQAPYTSTNTYINNLQHDFHFVNICSSC